MKTFSAKAHEVNHEWFVVDAEDKVLGRLASKIAHVLRGKHKAIYTPHVDTGDFVVVTNADKLVVTGKKTLQKILPRLQRLLHTVGRFLIMAMQLQEQQTLTPMLTTALLIQITPKQNLLGLPQADMQMR